MNDVPRETIKINYPNNSNFLFENVQNTPPPAIPLYHPWVPVINPPMQGVSPPKEDATAPRTQKEDPDRQAAYRREEMALSR